MEEGALLIMPGPSLVSRQSAPGSHRLFIKTLLKWHRTGLPPPSFGLSGEGKGETTAAR
jgi:hypothetical protein